MSVRPAYVAGHFYPESPRILHDTVKRHMDESGVTPAPGRVLGLISPHAGYLYSGPTAGYAFARVRGKSFSRVILLGRSHRAHFTGISLFDGDSFETPLGRAPLDAAFMHALRDNFTFASSRPHEHEHSLETQLPFLQAAVGEVPIVPVLFGNDPESFHVTFGQDLAAMMGENDLLIASTDLSHYLAENAAIAMDRHTLDIILNRNAADLARALQQGQCSLCGGPAVVAMLSSADSLGPHTRNLLDYRTSARVSGDVRQVVGYAAVSLEQGQHP